MKRGFRDASHVTQRGLGGRGDHIVLPALRRASPPVVLVTFDNNMPYAHEGVLRRQRLPLAIVDSVPDRTPLTESEYHFDVVHRWAHLIAQLRPGSVTWYRRDGYAPHTIDALPSPTRRGRRRARGG